MRLPALRNPRRKNKKAHTTVEKAKNANTVERMLPSSSMLAITVNAIDCRNGRFSIIIELMAQLKVEIDAKTICEDIVVARNM